MTNNIKLRFSTEVIMAAYNNADYTRATLEGFIRQSEKNFSITVADDGSDQAIKNLVKTYKDRLSIQHIWQKDQGYRRALILNKAIASSKSDYLIFIDNDCIPHRYFIKDHILNAEESYATTGRRVNLGNEISHRLISDTLHLKSLESTPSLLYLSLKNQIKDVERGIHLPYIITRIIGRKKRGLLGSNMAVWKTDLTKVNGFDSSFKGYGAEETDLQWRLEACDVSIKPLINTAIQFHLYHKQKKIIATNLGRIKQKKEMDMIRSPHGIEEAMNEP